MDIVAGSEVVSARVMTARAGCRLPSSRRAIIDQVSRPAPTPIAEVRPRVLSTVERAYQIAREGPASSVEDIRRQLDREGYSSVASHLGGPTLRKQLRQLCLARTLARTATLEG